LSQDRTKASSTLSAVAVSSCITGISTSRCTTPTPAHAAVSKPLKTSTFVITRFANRADLTNRLTSKALDHDLRPAV